jgi:hypothetical protein
MNTSRKLLLATLAAASLGLTFAPAKAAPWGGGPGMGYGPGGGNCMGPGRMGGMGRGMTDAASVDASLAALKAQLGIAPHQEGAWQAYAGRVREHAERMQAQRQARPCFSLSGADHLACREATWQQRAQDRDAVANAANALRSQLTPEQNGIFGNWPAPMAGRGMRGTRW